MGINHSSFNKITLDEMKGKFTVNTITTGGLFYAHTLKNSTISKRNYMTSKAINISNEKGIYIIWEDTNKKIEGKNLLHALYVGEGDVIKRLYEHTENKQLGETVHISFFTIDLRIALYLEQAFLENYEFPLNTKLKTGTKPLFAIISDDMYKVGNDKFLYMMAYKNVKHEKLIDKDADEVDLEKI